MDERAVVSLADTFRLTGRFQRRQQEPLLRSAVNAGLEALPLLGQVMSDYATLTGACSAHGVTLPPITGYSASPSA